MKITEPPIIIEEQFDASAEKLWNAITQIDEMKKWYFENIDNFNPVVGSKSKFVIKNEGRIFTHCWEVTEVIPLKKITYNWKYPEYRGDSFVTFELQESNNITLLQLSVIVVENFDDSIPEFKRESCIGGWNYFIRQRLKKYLEK